MSQNLSGSSSDSIECLDVNSAKHKDAWDDLNSDTDTDEGNTTTIVTNKVKSNKPENGLGGGSSLDGVKKGSLSQDDTPTPIASIDNGHHFNFVPGLQEFLRNVEEDKHGRRSPTTGESACSKVNTDDPFRSGSVVNLGQSSTWRKRSAYAANEIEENEDEAHEDEGGHICISSNNRKKIRLEDMLMQTLKFESEQIEKISSFQLKAVLEQGQNLCNLLEASKTRYSEILKKLVEIKDVKRVRFDTDE